MERRNFLKGLLGAGIVSAMDIAKPDEAISEEIETKEKTKIEVNRIPVQKHNSIYKNTCSHMFTEILENTVLMANGPLEWEDGKRKHKETFLWCGSCGMVKRVDGGFPRTLCQHFDDPICDGCKNRPDYIEVQKGGKYKTSFWFHEMDDEMAFISWDRQMSWLEWRK